MHSENYKGNDTVVIWILLNLMLIDSSGYYKVRTETNEEYRNRVDKPAKRRFGVKFNPKRSKAGRLFETKNPIHPLNSRMRTDGEVQDLLVDVCQRVKQLAEQRKGQVILVGPMPRHYSRCCDDKKHMHPEFKASEFTSRCYMLSTFWCSPWSRRTFMFFTQDRCSAGAKSPRYELTLKMMGSTSTRPQRGASSGSSPKG